MSAILDFTAGKALGTRPVHEILIAESTEDWQDSRSSSLGTGSDSLAGLGENLRHSPRKDDLQALVSADLDSI